MGELFVVSSRDTCYHSSGSPSSLRLQNSRNESRRLSSPRVKITADLPASNCSVIVANVLAADVLVVRAVTQKQEYDMSVEIVYSIA
ncbi:hypothetical protein M0657_008625 [Pyricularia oryzae]|nr:hypothetical protein M9X92_009457 [Pyricularia oryzae]KAI7916362.1 hypothetical protein M0657_008625 [Pyricularia oryzae]